jgi:hypothetical protein
MTRARALKSVIRARISKTGERYTTARRHVLAAGSAPARRAVPRQPEVAAPTPPVVAKGSVSDATSRARTGQGLDHWFAVLDAFGAVERGHTAAARHLHDTHGVPGWHAQGITVAYERARGVRAVNQRRSGEYEGSVTKVVAGGSGDVVAAFMDLRRRTRWTRNIAPAVAKALDAALGAPSSKGFVVRPDGQARYRFRWSETVVQFYVYPKPAGKAQVVVTHSTLPSADALEMRRAEWRAALAALAAYLADRA